MIKAKRAVTVLLITAVTCSCAGCAAIYREHMFYPEVPARGRIYREFAPLGWSTGFRPTHFSLQERGVRLALNVENAGETVYLAGPLLPIFPMILFKGLMAELDPTLLEVSVLILPGDGALTVDYDAVTISSPAIGRLRPSRVESQELRPVFGGGAALKRVEVDPRVRVHPADDDQPWDSVIYLYFDTGEPDLQYFDLEFEGIEIDGERVPPIEVRFTRGDPLITGIFSING